MTTPALAPVCSVARSLPLPAAITCPAATAPSSGPATVPDSASDAALVVPVRMVNEVLYCERLMVLEWVQGEFEDNVYTVDGRIVHKRADREGGRLPCPVAPREAAVVDGANAAIADGANRVTIADGANAAIADGANRVAIADGANAAPAQVPELPYVARAVWLTSERLSMTAKIDIVEGDGARGVVPIEYKRGHAPDVPGGAYLPERAQVCAQALLLRDHGYECDHGELYFAADRRRVRVELDDALIAATLAAVVRAKELATKADELPAPLVASPKCHGCSLVGICLPDEVHTLREATPELEVELQRDEGEGMAEAGVAHALGDEVGKPEADDDATSTGEAEGEGEAKGEAAAATDCAHRGRRLHPACDDRVPLYVQAQGAYVTLDAETIVVRARDGEITRARLPNLAQLSVFGNVQITTPALRALLDRGIPVSFFSYGGWFTGRAIGLDSKNVHLRMRQYRGAMQKELCVRIARRLVVSKILNSRTLLRRNSSSVSAVVLSELKQLARKAHEAESLATLLGIEGSAARVYFGAFPSMLSERALSDGFDLEGRNRRPPRDPINALLSFVYGLLTKEFVIALTHVGLDPLLGFYHQPRHGRPALALDLLEEFRPIIADSVVVGAVNTGVVRPSDFLRSAVGVALTAPARKRIINAYERRMDQLVTHPVFGYRISYRRVIEVQARLLSRLLFGEIDAYPVFRTR